MIKSYYRRLSARIQRWNDQRAAARTLDREAMSAIHAVNRRLLSAAPPWISDEVWQGGVFQYGLPPEVRPLIDLDIGADLTYTDALLSLAPRLRKPVRYLEIGVSVGKNFWQVASYLKDASLVGFDIEEINPVLSGPLAQVARHEWATQPASLKKTRSSMTAFRQPGSTNELQYLCGDVFDPQSWKALAGRPFNLIFSDAFHSPEALLTECDMLLEHGLLDDDGAIIMWDDLDGPMEEAFRESCRRLVRHRAGFRNTSFVVPLRGWMGENWPHHNVGFLLSERGQ